MHTGVVDWDDVKISEYAVDLIIADIFEVEYTAVNGSNIANGAVCSL